MDWIPEAIVTAPNGPFGAVAMPQASATAAHCFSAPMPPPMVTSGIITSIIGCSSTSRYPLISCIRSPPARVKSDAVFCCPEVVDGKLTVTAERCYFQGVKTIRNGGTGTFRKCFRGKFERVAGDIGINANLIVTASAQKSVGRHTERFPKYVPESLFDGAEGVDADPFHRGHINHFGQVCDLAGVFADQQLLQLA